jgi:hypothetical protein
MHESIVVAANYDFTLADQSWEKACEMCKQDTHCFALCSGFTIRLVLIDYELQGYEKFVFYDYIEKLWRDVNELKLKHEEVI